MVKIEAEHSESALLHRIQTVLKVRTSGSRAAAVALGIGDDAALFRPRPGFETILTCDWSLDGTHFLPDRHPPESVGWKCLARAASDIAAMGGDPRCFLFNLALPINRAGRWLERLLAGLRAASRRLHCPVAGGDTTRSDHILINITVVGECRRGRALLRTGARPDDALFVTGRLGEAEYGLHLVRAGLEPANPRDRRLQKHLYPLPRLAVGGWLAAHRFATAAMDLSDGLSTDLARLCAASGVGATLDSALLPKVVIAKSDRAKKLDATLLTLHGGDDYELLFTVAPENLAGFPKSVGGVPLTRIGTVTKRKQIRLRDDSGGTRLLDHRGWDPFR